MGVIRRGVLLTIAIVLAAAPASGQAVVCSFPDHYPGDAADRSMLAAWMAAGATGRGLPPELPVMAALVESDIQNLPGGDADSVGYFQMRVDIWNQGIYAGYPQNPDLQLAWFIDQAIGALNRAPRPAARQYLDDSDAYGRWIADAFGPGGKDRKRYQSRLEEARHIIAEGRVRAGSWPFVGEYPGDEAPAETVAAWMASRAGAAGLPKELPIMAALVESGLRNLPSDGGAAGYFAMRVSIWDVPPYTGFADKPELQMKWFIDQAHAARASRIAAGADFFGSDPAQWGEWIADVERPAEHLRGRYQLKLEEARVLMRSGCAAEAHRID
jgi:hypothetical protein